MRNSCISDGEAFLTSNSTGPALTLSWLKVMPILPSLSQRLTWTEGGSAIAGVAARIAEPMSAQIGRRRCMRVSPVINGSPPDRVGMREAAFQADQLGRNST